MPFIPRDFNFLWRADLSIPIKSAVFEMLPWFFLSWVIKYSFSKCSLASLRGEAKDFSKIFLSLFLSISLITSPLLITHSVHAQDKAQSALEKLRGDDIKKITESKALKDKNA